MSSASMIQSVILLIAVNCIAARWRYATFGSLVLGVGSLGVPFCLCVTFPAVMIQAFLLGLLLPVLRIPDRGQRLYLGLSCLTTLLIYGVFLAYNFRESERLRRQYPFESMEDRLPRRINLDVIPLKDSDLLDHQEQMIEKETDMIHPRRAARLRELHEQSVHQFANQQGFGVGRMLRTPTFDAYIKNGLRPDSAVPQPYDSQPITEPVKSSGPKMPEWDSTKLIGMHLNGVVDFVNPIGFGYIKSRREVTGFQSHAMSRLPETEKPWRIARIDLIGLQVYEEPVAYISANLPRMDELRKAPTRPLDAFEKEALKSLRTGDEEFTRGTNDKVRMVGAIRTTKQCIDCHGGSRGDLLGAFSYGFQREEK